MTGIKIPRTVKKALPVAMLLVGALGILACTVYKASHASMTHDESSTYLNLVEINSLHLWSCYHNPECWTTANNHLLNTLLMRWSASFFGPGELALRLPNLLLLLIYLLCVLGILRQTAHSIAETLFGLALLTCNPFVLDFFALARGYGMGLGFTMLSMFGMWKYYGCRRAGYGVLAFGAAVAAVFANLIYLAFVAALMVAVFLGVVMPALRNSWKAIAGVIPLSMAASLAILGAYFYHPVLALKGLGEFTYGASSLLETWTGFVSDSLYGVSWLGQETVGVVALGCALIVVLCIIVPWVGPLRATDNTEKEFRRFLSILVTAMIFAFVFNHLLTGAYYPSGRKAIVFSAPISLLVFIVLPGMMAEVRPWGRRILSILGIVMVLHFFRAFQGHTFREWWYDANTRDMIYYVADKATAKEPVTLGVEWIFHPSTQFYIQTQDLPVDLAPYSREISKELPVAYYYLRPEFAGQLEPIFFLEKNFEGKQLLKRK